MSAANGTRPSARVKPVPPLLATREEAARLMAMSVDSFERYIQGEVRLVRVGSMVLVPVSELERWVERHSQRTLEPA